MGISNLFLMAMCLTFASTIANLADKWKPRITKMHIVSNVSYTYAVTCMWTEFKNFQDNSHEFRFKARMLEDDFVTDLSMFLRGKEYKSYVKSVEDAKEEYNKAVSAGHSSAHVSKDSKDTKELSIDVNVEALATLEMKMCYEGSLSRIRGRYRHTIHINPLQIVEDFSVVVNIEDTLNVIDLKVTDFLARDSDPQSWELKYVAANKCVLTWSPTSEEQEVLNKDGLNGKAVIEYDVDATVNSQLILMDDDGYFVHFLREDNWPIMSKHVVFVLDLSDSMHWDEKLPSLKVAMELILKDMPESDYFSILPYSHDSAAWNPISNSLEGNLNKKQHTDIPFKKEYIVQATKENVDKAVRFIKSLRTQMWTNINGALINGIRLARLGRQELPGIETMIIFLTDGIANVDDRNHDRIVSRATGWRNPEKFPFYTLGLGKLVMDSFLIKLANVNNAFYTHIYATKDAATQLTNFYQRISSPVLKDVKVVYESQVEQVTSDDSKYVFNGSDISIAGRLIGGGVLQGHIEANTNLGKRTYLIRPTDIQKLPGSSLERMWANRYIKDRLEKHMATGDQTYLKSATQLSLKYSFVTSQTSLIVVKPDGKTITTVNNDYNPAFGESVADGSGNNAHIMITTDSIKVPSRGEAAGIQGVSTEDDQEMTKIKEDLERVPWIDLDSISSDGQYLQPPPALNTTDIIALKPDMSAFVEDTCGNGEPCRHFIHCLSPVISTSEAELAAMKCHIEPNFLGVCCPS